MKRRLLIAGTVAAAAGAGAGVAWRLTRPPELDAGEQAFWATRLEAPAGGELALASWRGRPLLVNFWATWCAPCIEEMPELDRFARGQPGLSVLGVAVDRADAVRRFLADRPVGYAVGIAGFGGARLAQALGNPGSGLPFTVLMDADGRRVRHKLGPVDETELRGWIDAPNRG